MKRLKLKADNSGFSLIEVIVSILILSIVVLPLLRTFVVSARTNGTAKAKQISAEASESVMEGVKHNGILNSAAELNELKDLTLIDGIYVGDDTECFEVKYNEVTGKYTRIENQSLLSVQTGADGELEFVSNNTGKYYYAINNIEKDNRQMDMIIEFDSSPYTGNEEVKQNLYEIPDVSSLNSENTAVINLQSYDARAVSYFYNLYENHAFDLWLLEYQEAVSAGLPAPEFSLGLSESEIKNRIRKETNIYLTGADNNVNVNADITYIFDNTGGIICENGDEFETELCNKVYSGFYTEKNYPVLESVYLFFEQYETTSYANDIINIYNGENSISATDADFFIATQEDLAGIHSVNLAVDVFEGANKTLNLYSDMSLVKSNGQSYPNSAYTNSLYAVSGTKDRIYDINIYVYESTPGNRYEKLYTSLSSSTGE